ncbi:hypothetical protein L6452_35502 [Arctium lappa]|uniref:Uncharacterized protein n=1 Tax=Arctium lappa TaxID=4217 RepID=A0ACB8Y5V5_ARCLA|nr:hypothetical protein L6452_35502 [Arctium lappa]
MASGVRVMEKPVQLQHHQPQQQQQQHQQHEALKCPRCDSSNTKFCYYNNYSLSQPRHFCKACKRYWTRGGTLRNVPVGGGCRKNKRVKRPSTTTTPPLDHHTNPNPNPNPNPNLDHRPLPSSTTSNSNTNHHLNPLFYGLLPQNPNFPRFDIARVSSDTLVSGAYDLLHQPHMNGSGLGFSSSGPGASLVASHGQNSSLTFSNYPTSMYGGGGGSNCSSTSAPTMASLLASTLNQQQQRFMGFAAYDGSSSMVKDPKMEATQNRMDQWNNNNNNFHGQNNKDDQIEAVVVNSSDPNNSLLWDTTPGDGGGGWLDATNNIGSSVPSLI